MTVRANASEANLRRSCGFGDLCFRALADANETTTTSEATTRVAPTNNDPVGAPLVGAPCLVVDWTA